MTTILIAITVACVAALSWLTYYFSSQAYTRKQTRRLNKALTTTQAIFNAVDNVPNVLISRDLRRGLVLIINFYINELTELNAKHPHLYYLQTRIQKLNQIPTGFERLRIRSKADRKRASSALDTLANLIKQENQNQVIESKYADLARAAASFAAQQIAVETARQAAKDAENVRAYGAALNFTYQAQALCRKLPPMMAEALGESVAADVERLEGLTGRAPASAQG